MFNSNKDEDSSELGFADSYKFDILHKDDDADEASKNLIIILALIAIILGLSIFGYIYMSKSTTQPNSEEVVEEVVEEPTKPPTLNNIDELLLGEGQADSVEEIDDGGSESENSNPHSKTEKKN